MLDRTHIQTAVKWETTPAWLDYPSLPSIQTPSFCTIHIASILMVSTSPIIIVLFLHHPGSDKFRCDQTWLTPKDVHHDCTREFLPLPEEPLVTPPIRVWPLRSEPTCYISSAVYSRIYTRSTFRRKTSYVMLFRILSWASPTGTNLHSK